MLRDEGDDVEAAISCPHAFTSLSEHGDEAMQRLRRSRLVLHHGDADIVRAGIAAVRLLAREITSGDHANTRFGPQSFCCDLAAALPRHVEPKKKTSSWAFIAVAVADDLVREIKFFRIKLSILSHMLFILIRGDRDILRRRWNLWRCDIAQLEIRAEKSPISGRKPHAHAGQV